MKNGLSLLAGVTGLALAAAAPSVSIAAPYTPDRTMSGLDIPSSSKLSAEEQVRQTLSRYTRAIDTRDLDAYVDLFTPDGRIEILQRDPEGGLTPAFPAVVGRDDIAKGAAGFMQTRQGDISHHFTHDHIISIDGNTARINAQFVVTHARRGEPVVPSVGGSIVTTLTGYYNLRLRKVQGRWLIADMQDIFDLPYRDQTSAAAPAVPEAVSPKDRAEILDLYARYAFYVDQRQSQAWASLFVPDGELRAPTGVDGGRMVIKGTAKLAQAIEDWGKSGKTAIHAMMAPVLIKVADGHVRALTTVMTGKIDPARAYAANFNGYGMSYDDIVKVNGRWLFQTRESYIYNGEPIRPEFLPRPDAAR